MLTWTIRYLLFIFFYYHGFVQYKFGIEKILVKFQSASQNGVLYTLLET